MSIKLSRGIILSSVAGAAVALGLALSGAQAQPYDSGAYAKGSNDDVSSPYAKDSSGDAPVSASDYGADSSATVGGVTVYASPRNERSFNGAPIETLTASRVVPIADLDLSTGWGVHELRARVEHAAYEACNQLDNTLGYVTADGANDVDCQHDAVRQAMDSAPITYGR